ncbi:hypothetical protein SAMN05421806_11278 [Streptomyces indicus]|uniref:Uncharacterized protein n=2 Tax=Streptomyces indicus TaxID=417292 RepID=A0A1G9EV45_9ACTN|nr:hypothetical protein [Streptomyces indicus]SDK80036.1 hypothetical protein SAMN05421806_11278 [Streptomyces indicus]
MSALIAVVLLAVLLPLAGAAAGPAGPFDTPDDVRDERASGVRDEGAADGRGERAAEQQRTGSAPEDGKAPAAEDDESADGVAAGGAVPADDSAPGLLAGLGLTTAAQCGPELASPEGVEAQTCVLSQGEQTWARTYYRNATGEELSSVLTLMGPGGRTVQMHCVVDEDDEPGACETPRERTAGDRAAYTAVAEFAAREESADAEEGSGPMLLRSGSNEASAAGR